MIDVENIYRRLRENRSLPAPRPAWRVVLEASHIGLPAATLAWGVSRLRNALWHHFTQFYYAHLALRALGGCRRGVTWGLEAALRGASERLAPILMTALVTGLGLLPLALGSGDPGREIEGPMAIVILGGLITSTVLNLLVLPTLSLRFGRFEPRRES